MQEPLTREYLMLAILVLILIGLIAFIIRNGREESMQGKDKAHS
jgi:hypothetical protein